MQMSENNLVDTRTFPEIWRDLSVDEKAELRGRLLNSKVCQTVQTVNNWGAGRFMPTNLVVRKEAARVISLYLKVKTLPGVLFPMK